MQIRISFLVNDANKKNTYINQSEHFRPKKKKKYIIFQLETPSNALFEF